MLLLYFSGNDINKAAIFQDVTAANSGNYVKKHI
jgi:hypothetical protein